MQDALGRFVNRDVRIIGVVADARYNTFRDTPARVMFLPFTQAPPRSTMTFIVRPAGDQRQTISAVTAAIRAHDPQLKVSATPMSSLVEATMGRERFAARSPPGSRCSRCSCPAPACTRRSRSLYPSAGGSSRCGSRSARPGATSRGWSLQGPIRVALAGIVVGVPCAYALMRAVSTLLFGVAPFDLHDGAGVRAWRCSDVAVAAAALPAWRAASIDPQECLRSN